MRRVHIAAGSIGIASGAAQAPSQQGLLLLKQPLESGAIVPVIDRSYPLPEAVDSIRYLLGGHARGKVVICV